MPLMALMHSHITFLPSRKKTSQSFIHPKWKKDSSWLQQNQECISCKDELKRYSVFSLPCQGCEPKQKEINKGSQSWQKLELSSHHNTLNTGLMPCIIKATLVLCFPLLFAFLQSPSFQNLRFFTSAVGRNIQRQAVLPLHPCSSPSFLQSGGAQLSCEARNG